MADTQTSAADVPSGGLQGSLRPSLLSAKADAMWSASKQQFENSGKTISMGAIKLKTKTFSEVADKQKEEKAAVEEAPKPKFIFGQNVTSRFVQSSNNSIPSNEKEDIKTPESIFKAVDKGDNGLVPKDFEEFKKEAQEAAAKHKDELEQNVPTTSIIEVKTGEEEDQVVFQTGCKLHVFDKQQKRWVEKGMAILKINRRVDESGEHHRIVARTTGIHKLVINSKIFPDMTLERVDQKRLKISAMGADDPPSLQIFLVTFSFTNSDLSIEGAANNLQALINKSKQEQTRKRKLSETEQVSEVESKMEKADITNSNEKFTTGGFEDIDHSSSSVGSNDVSSDPRDSAHEADNEQQTSDSN